MTRPAILRERFLAKVDIRGLDECWPWLGSRNPKGYGKFWPALQAHRVAFALANGRDPFSMNPDIQVMHSCDFPPCCNPLHLSEGSNQDNAREMFLKGRGFVLPPGSYQVLTLHIAREIRARHLAGESMTSISGALACSRQTVSNVIHNRTYVESQGLHA